ncbi:MAG: PilZ domain-containing protein [Acidobacteria bacterium]|jgi:hypothetical protein|nr:PilZ domain-containing protein [Acidobacteriota bacterium]MCH7986803.1 PilZ domain-containing protein [Acidobacteriota bacterium]
MTTERRVHQRIKPERMLVVEYPDYLGRVVDLSPSGAFIEDERPLRLGETLPFKLWLNSVEAVEVSGVIRRVEEGSGIAVEFVGLKETEYNRLCEFLDTRPLWQM